MGERFVSLLFTECRYHITELRAGESERDKDIMQAKSCFYKNFISHISYYLWVNILG